MKLMVTAAMAVLAAGCAGEPQRLQEPASGVGQNAQTGDATTAATWHSQHATLFERTWGVDVVGVRRISSGQMLRFDYRILDQKKAATLQDKTVKPYLTDEATGTRLAVPAMENVGELRQTSTPVQGRTYFMIFGNPGGLVKSGGRVSVAIGGFHAEGLIVE